jgi:dihydrofolate synthase / folylpolyglutamate synthase
MQVQSIQTEPITTKSGNLLAVLEQYLPPLTEGTVLAITSKIVSICEGRVVDIQSEEDKERLIQQEADYWLPRSSSKYNVSLTIKDGILAASAGIDESNSFGKLVLLPQNSQRTANLVRQHFTKKYNLRKFGVILTDSISAPLRWGTRGTALAHSGFEAIKDYIGTQDIFGRPLAFSKASILDGLAGSAVLVMGEGKERQPLALLTDLPFVSFQDRDPTQEEIRQLLIEPEDDLYAPLLNNAKWKKKEV